MVWHSSTHATEGTALWGTQHDVMCMFFSSPVPFMVCLAVTVPCTTYLTLAPADWLPGLWSFMTMRPPPYFLFRVAIFEMILLYITLTYLLEVSVPNRDNKCTIEPPVNLITLVVLCICWICHHSLCVYHY